MNEVEDYINYMGTKTLLSYATKLKLTVWRTVGTCLLRAGTTTHYPEWSWNHF